MQSDIHWWRDYVDIVLYLAVFEDYLDSNPLYGQAREPIRQRQQVYTALSYCNVIYKTNIETATIRVHLVVGWMARWGIDGEVGGTKPLVILEECWRAGDANSSNLQIDYKGILGFNLKLLLHWPTHCSTWLAIMNCLGWTVMYAAPGDSMTFSSSCWSHVSDELFVIIVSIIISWLWIMWQFTQAPADNGYYLHPGSDSSSSCYTNVEHPVMSSIQSQSSFPSNSSYLSLRDCKSLFSHQIL